MAAGFATKRSGGRSNAGPANFREWGVVFAGDAVMASAALDRLLHRATVINTCGESYRLRDKRRAGQADASDAAAPQDRKEVRA